MKILNKIILIILVAVSCSVLVDPVVPDCIYENTLDGTIELPQATRCRIEGVYNVVQGNDVFGNKVVIKACQGYISVFAEKNAAIRFCFLQRDQQKRSGTASSSNILTRPQRLVIVASSAHPDGGK